MIANAMQIADPQDAGSLDVVGFDASVPAIIAEFLGARRGSVIGEEEPA